VDALVVLIIAVIIWLTHRDVSGEVESADADMYTVKLNPEFYDDANAFMVYANELGFH
jgi:hypothetical protein